MIWDDFKSIVQGVTDFFNEDNYIKSDDNQSIYDNHEIVAAIAENARAKEIAYANLEKEISQLNQDFSIQQFLIYAGTVFMSLLNTKNTMILEPTKNCIHDDLYNLMCEDYKILKSKGEINLVKNISIEGSTLESYQNDKESELLTVRLKAKFMDYFVEAETGSFRRGNRYDKRMHDCKLIFIKNMHYDKVADEKEIINCPNCGAPLEAGSLNTCKYCNTVVALPKKQWLLMSFEIKEIVNSYLYEKS